MAKEVFTTNLFPKGNPFNADFYIVADIQIDSYGSPETGRGYLADPMNYDPGSDPEWSLCKVKLFLDCGGDGEPVQIGPKFAEAIMEYIEADKDLCEQVCEAIGKFARDEYEYARDCALGL